MHQQLSQALIQTRTDELNRLRRHHEVRPARSVRLGRASVAPAARRALITPLRTRLIPAR
jgi:hypothetical protein